MQFDKFQDLYFGIASIKDAERGNTMAVFKTRVPLTNIRYAECILHIVDDIVDDGVNLTFYVPTEKAKKFLGIMSACGIWVKKC